MFNKMSAGQKVNGLGVRNDNTRNFSINFFVSQVNCSIINFVCLSSVSQTITLFGNLILSIAFQDKLFFFVTMRIQYVIYLVRWSVSYVQNINIKNI